MRCQPTFHDLRGGADNRRHGREEEEEPQVVLEPDLAFGDDRRSGIIAAVWAGTVVDLVLAFGALGHGARILTRREDESNRVAFVSDEPLAVQVSEPGRTMPLGYILCRLACCIFTPTQPSPTCADDIEESR
jgi:hypothetical protein